MRKRLIAVCFFVVAGAAVAACLGRTNDEPPKDDNNSSVYLNTDFGRRLVWIESLPDVLAVSDTDLVEPTAMTSLESELLIRERGANWLLAFDTKSKRFARKYEYAIAALNDRKRRLLLVHGADNRIEMFDHTSGSIWRIGNDGADSLGSVRTSNMVTGVCKIAGPRYLIASPTDEAGQFVTVDPTRKEAAPIGVGSELSSGGEKLLRQFVIGSAGNNGCLAAALYSDKLLRFDSTGQLLASASQIDSSAFAELVIDTTEMGIRRSFSNESRTGAYSVASTRNYAYVAYGGRTKLANRVVDVYALDDLSYCATLLFPARVRLTHGMNRDLFVVLSDSVFSSRIIRVSERAIPQTSARRCSRD